MNVKVWTHCSVAHVFDMSYGLKLILLVLNTFQTITTLIEYKNTYCSWQICKVCFIGKKCKVVHWRGYVWLYPLILRLNYISKWFSFKTLDRKIWIVKVQMINDFRLFDTAKMFNSRIEEYR